jgi:RNA polymerase primary sigma factor
MTLSDVKLSMKNSGRHLSMDAPLREGEDFSLYDVVSSTDSPRPDNDLMADSLKLEINRALETLSNKEGDVIKLYYGLGGEMPMSLDEIGVTFDLSRERVRQIKEKGIRRLRHTSKSKILKTYLG